MRCRADLVQIEQRLAVARHEGVDIDQLLDPVARAVGDAGRDHAAIAVADQHDVAQVFIFDDVEDVLDMGFEIDRRIRQMRALAKTGVGRRDQPMPGGLPSADASSSTPIPPTTRRGRRERLLP